MPQVKCIGIIARAMSLESKMKSKSKEFFTLSRAWLEMGLLLTTTKVTLHGPRHRPKNSAGRLNNGTFHSRSFIQQAAWVEARDLV
jgi:hypothetical protein